VASRESSIVLVSGGMDSLVAAAVAMQESTPSFLHVSYGQRTEKRELTAFRDLAGHYGIDQVLECDISYLTAIGGSSLTDFAMPVRTGGVEKSEVPDSYVPFRNAHLIAIAVSWAEVIGAGRIYLGAVEEDSSGYPDCTEGFFQAMEGAIRSGTARAGNLAIHTPLLHLSKEEIVRLGIELQVPFDLSWSCYTGEEFACGECDSCRLRLKAFKLNKLTDPIPYRPLDDLSKS
jgi:7-cyano-7-deazaguanine synthase